MLFFKTKCYQTQRHFLMGSDISPSQHLAKIDVGILRKKKVNRNYPVAADISVTLAIQRSE